MMGQGIVKSVYLVNDEKEYVAQLEKRDIKFNFSKYVMALVREQMMADPKYLKKQEEDCKTKLEVIQKTIKEETDRLEKYKDEYLPGIEKFYKKYRAKTDYDKEAAINWMEQYQNELTKMKTSAEDMIDYLEAKL